MPANFLESLFQILLLVPGPDTEFKLGLDWKEVKKEPDDILNLAEKIVLKIISNLLSVSMNSKIFPSLKILLIYRKK